MWRGLIHSLKSLLWTEEKMVVLRSHDREELLMRKRKRRNICTSVADTRADEEKPGSVRRKKRVHEPLQIHLDVNRKRLARKAKVLACSELSKHSKENTLSINQDNLDQQDQTTKRIALDHKEQESEEQQQVNTEEEDKKSEKTLDTVRLGKVELECWFSSAYPSSLCSVSRRLFICSQCFKYSTSETASQRHSSKCTLLVPPGPRIYTDRHRDMHVFQVDGQRNREYCQNLCLFCKLFLDQKSLFYDVDNFDFFVLVVNREVCGYFSREKVTSRKSQRAVNNLSCILTFPQHHGKGYGKFLVSLSYALSRLDGKVAGPEKPLSKFGEFTYRSFWRTEILDELLSLKGIDNKVKDAEEVIGELMFMDDVHTGKSRRARGKGAEQEKKGKKMKKVVFSIEELSKKLGILPSDIVETLQDGNLLFQFEGKPCVYLDLELVRSHLERRADALVCDPSKLLHD